MATSLNTAHLNPARTTQGVTMMRCPVHHTSSQLATPPLMAQLREATRPHHDRVESLSTHTQLLAGQLPIERWFAQLHAYLIIHQTLELASQLPSNHAAVHHVWQPSLIRSHLLAKDLSHLDPLTQHTHTPAQHAAQHTADHLLLLAQSADPALLGALYVIEGSSLGNLVIRRHIIQHYHIPPHHLSFLQGHHQDSMTHWRAFGARLELAAPVELHPHIIRGAQNMFDHISSLLQTLSP